MPPKKGKKVEEEESDGEIFDLPPEEETEPPPPRELERYFTIEDIIAFCFPENVLHSRSTARLLLFARYGSSLVNMAPKCKACKVNCPNIYRKGRCTWHLTGGYRNRHIVTQQELLSMIYRIETEDIISIYCDSVALTPEDEAVILNQAESGGKQLKKELKHLIGSNYTKDNVTDMFDELPRYNGDEMKFSDIQRVILDEHVERIKQCKKVFPDLVSAKPRPNKNKTKPKAPPQYTEEEQFLRTQATKRLSEINPQTRMRALHTSVYKLSDIENANHPGLVENVVLMRDLKTETQDRRKVALSDEIDERRDIRLQIISKVWDTNCCLRKQNIASRVKSKNTSPSIIHGVTPESPPRSKA